MSLAGDILKGAVESAQKHIIEQSDRVGKVAEEFRQHLGKPWKFRADAIREAQTLNAETESPAE